MAGPDSAWLKSKSKEFGFLEADWTLGKDQSETWTWRFVELSKTERSKVAGYVVSFVYDAADEKKSEARFRSSYVYGWLRKRREALEAKVPVTMPVCLQYDSPQNGYDVCLTLMEIMERIWATEKAESQKQVEESEQTTVESRPCQWPQDKDDARKALREVEWLNKHADEPQIFEHLIRLAEFTHDELILYVEEMKKGPTVYGLGDAEDYE